MRPPSPTAATCWTCRARKKKCDRKRPTCDACRTLSITCDQSIIRPSWMNSTHERHEFAQWIRAEIKQKSEVRRQRPYVKASPLRNDILVEDPPPNTNTSGRLAPQAESELQELFHTRNPVSSLGRTTPDEDPATGSVYHPSTDDTELDLQITFLDHVFPFFYPFYHPSIFDGGRSWVLASLRNSTPLFHTAMSLNTYFIALALNTDDAQHEVCKGAILAKLDSHLDTAIKAMRKGIDELGVVQVGVSVSQRACLLDGIVQLLVFGTGMAKTMDGHIHIAAAASLFKDIIDACGMRNGKPDLQLVLDTMVRPGRDSAHSDYRNFNNEQAAFRLFVAVLLSVDIISSTAVGTAPQLQSYHPFLIDDGRKPYESKGPLRMEDFVGCQGWVLLVVADITTVGCQRKRRELSHCGMLDKSRAIGERLERGITDLNADCNGWKLLMPPSLVFPGV